MALTRAMLKGMGLTDEQIGAIIEEHTNVTGGLKDQIKTLKESADKLPEVEKELNDLKAGNDDWKGKYEKEHKAFDDYRKGISNKETLAKVKAAYRKLLKDANVGESHHDSILKVTDFGNIKLNEDGTLADGDYYALFGGYTGTAGAFAISAVPFEVKAAEPEEPEVPAKKILVGDVNLSGAVDSVDAADLALYLASIGTLTADGKLAADVNNSKTADSDGVDSVDAADLALYLAGISSFDVEYVDEWPNA